MLDYYVLQSSYLNNTNYNNNNNYQNDQSYNHFGTPINDNRYTSMVTFQTDDSKPGQGLGLGLAHGGLSPGQGLADSPGWTSGPGQGLDTIERVCQEGDVFGQVGRGVLRACFDPVRAMQWTLRPPEPIISPSPLQPHTRLMLSNNNNDNNNNNNNSSMITTPLKQLSTEQGLVLTQGTGLTQGAVAPPHKLYITRDEYGLLSPLNYAPSYCNVKVAPHLTPPKLTLLHKQQPQFIHPHITSLHLNSN